MTLHDACKRGDLEEVTSLLSKKECDINAVNTDGESPLHIACEYGHLEIVKVLSKNEKCNLNTKNMYDNTPLHLACYKKLLHIIRVLLERRCRTNIPNKRVVLAQCIRLNEDGDCLLHIACQWGDVDIVKYLITDERCDPNAQSSTSENTPLHIAAKYGQDDTIVELLSHMQCYPNVQNKEGDTPLQIACYKRSLNDVKLLLKKECSTNIPNKKGETAQNIPLNEDGDCLLHIACQWGDVDIVRHLITDQRCDPNVQSSTSGNTPLHIAAKFGQDDTIVELLSCKKCRSNAQNKKGDTPLHIAVRQNKIAAISQLLAHQQCDPNVKNRDGDAPLHFVAKYGQGDTMAELLSCKECNPNVQNKESDTPLHIAVRQNKIAAISQLLAHKQCNMYLQNREGDTPLHIACYKKSLDIIKLFLTKRCSTNIPNKKGETAQDIPLNEDGDCLLHIACQWGDVGIVRYFINDERCDPNVQSSTSGNTPLHIAAKFGQGDTIVELLSCKKCRSNAQNKKGDTPLHFAVRQNKIAVLSQLLAHQQCDPNVKNRDGDAPLHFAAKYGQGDTMAELLSCKECNPNVQNKESDTPLHIAVRQNKIAAISQLLVHKQCNMYLQNREGDTPLHIACYNKSLDIIKLFLTNRCSTNIPNKKGETAQNIPLNEDGDCLLHIACQWGDVNIVRYLITDQRCDPSVQSSTSGNIALHIAAKYGQDDTIVELLSCKKCRSNAQNKKGDTPLHFAVRQNKIAAISQLLAHQQCDPNVKNRDGDAPLHFAAKYGQGDTMAELLSCKECNPNVQNEESDTPLHIAVRQNEIAAISQLLVHKQCNMYLQNREGDTPLHIACYKKSLDIIKLFLTNRCSTNIPNMKGETTQDIPLNEDGDCLLHIACQWGDVDIVKYLINDERCNPNVQSSTSKNTPLHITTIWNNIVAISMLVAHPQCNINAQNKKGDTPLHIAVRQNKIAAISQLLAHQQCDPNVKNRDGDAPLHFAAKYGQGDTMAELLSCKECNPNVQNKESDTPLHITVRQNKIAAISQLLVHKQCNMYLQNREGDTPLHIACYNKSLDIIKLFLTKRCSTNIPNKKGETAQDIPLNEDGDCLLHIACQWGDVDIVKYLINDERYDHNVQSSTSGNTPLHIAAKYGQGDTIVELLSCKKCRSNAQNKKGDTPLHIAVRQNKIAAISQLLAHQQCNPNVKNRDGDAPLHIAAKYGQDDTIAELSFKESDSNAQNKDGDTPLHTAASKHQLSAIPKPPTTKQCNLNILNNYYLTPLLIAIKHNNSVVATALLQHKECDATLCDQHGNTPLHLACTGGETHPEMVEVAKQLLTSVDPSCVNNAGQTPIVLTTNYQLIQAISHMVQCKTKQSVQTYINMFIVGNPETGKSTLVKAIRKEATSILWKIVPKQVRKVKNVPLHTAGIIPTTFRSKTFGNTVIYDLAGQVEYYTSHAAVIRSTVISTPPAFIVVVNLCESEEKISQTLRYWWSFIDNHASCSSAPPEVILVGSHADRVKSTGGSVQQTLTQMTDILKQLPASFHFAGQVALDCRDPASRKLQHFCSLVNQSCTVLRVTADVDLRCHVLYAFLLERFQGKVSCRVSDVAASVKENRELLPQNSDSLIPLILTLSDKGLLLLVKGGESHRDWWIILQKQALLGEVNGVIFAPKNFSQHKDIFHSTGVVLFSKLMKEFPDHDPSMVTEFLIHLEFCFKIEDHQTLALLKEEATNVEVTSPDVSEEYYFFPALVSVEYPLHVWEENDKMACKCGWIYKCIRPDQFLTTQFLHVLILRLAFTFALKFDPGDCHVDLLALHRRCSVWKHGIAWLNTAPIETVVEVGLQHQSVIVMMRCPRGEETECVQLRSKVIKKVLQAKDEHCKAVKMSESFIHPGIVKYPFTDNTGDVKLYRYSLEEIARMIVQGKVNVLDRRGRNPISVQDLLLFDPSNTDTSPELLRELFSEKHSMEETVRSQVLETLNCESEKCMCPLCIPCA